MKDLPQISGEVVITTRTAIEELKNHWFQKGVERGKFEAGSTARAERVARNCPNWKDGRCETCGAQSQHHEVSAEFACPFFTGRRAKAS